MINLLNNEKIMQVGKYKVKSIDDNDISNTKLSGSIDNFIIYITW